MGLNTPSSLSLELLFLHYVGCSWYNTFDMVLKHHLRIIFSGWELWVLSALHVENVHASSKCGVFKTSPLFALNYIC